ncbi:MAG: hypothetical protein HeimC2_16380 [Candidatus Heimdallarchaeota archaeon LC_2]|nr:MAG: hypothetical protein HeimC2_16360 [Candidatus Heimdallarchaeota archaeon LC_2]OLS26145.1 MAG: hypothetical protein HeimC2_16370 [Candidatus Heimdallarchaeota archaeon LC_2]OLS26146.1 MAG: hypothetical protein HeimC2_16380 [Candidatus Heimdallarchaeota archaeon LC_2]
MFCQQCDAVLILKKEKGKKNSNQSRIIVCIDCGFKIVDNEESQGFLIKQEIEHGVEAFIEIVEFKDIDDKISEEMREELRERYREVII